MDAERIIRGAIQLQLQLVIKYKDKVRVVNPHVFGTKRVTEKRIDETGQATEISVAHYHLVGLEEGHPPEQGYRDYRVDRIQEITTILVEDTLFAVAPKMKASPDNWETILEEW